MRRKFSGGPEFSGPPFFLKPMINNLLKPLFIDLKKFFTDTLFPIRCVCCETYGEFICKNCGGNFKKLKHQTCIVCEKSSLYGLTHPSCNSPQTADGLISIFDYKDEKVSRAIIAGKYNLLPLVFNDLAQFMALDISQNFLNLIQDKILCPLPLHQTRKNWRGFNQAELLAEALGLRLNIPVKNLLQRKLKTKTQKDILERSQRLKNVRDAFALEPDARVKGKSIVIIDDVATTGATLLEAAKILKRSGAKTVWGLTVARD